MQPKTMNISYKDLVASEEVRRKIQAAIGEYDDPGQEAVTKVVWPCLKVFWFNKDNPTEHGERKKVEAD